MIKSKIKQDTAVEVVDSSKLFLARFAGAEDVTSSTGLVRQRNHRLMILAQNAPNTIGAPKKTPRIVSRPLHAPLKHTVYRGCHLGPVGFPMVKLHQQVNAGDQIGITGRTGNAGSLRSSEYHLHFGISKQPRPTLGLTDWEDPALYIQIGAAVRENCV